MMVPVSPSIKGQYFWPLFTVQPDTPPGLPLLSGSQSGISQGFMHSVATGGPFPPEGLYASAVAVAETSAVEIPKILANNVESAFPRAVERSTVTVTCGLLGTERFTLTSEESTCAAWPPIVSSSPTAMACCVTSAVTVAEFTAPEV